MKIKKLAVFTTVCVALMFGVWGCHSQEVSLSSLEDANMLLSSSTNFSPWNMGNHHNNCINFFENNTPIYGDTTSNIDTSAVRLINTYFQNNFGVINLFSVTDYRQLRDTVLFDDESVADYLAFGNAYLNYLESSSLITNFEKNILSNLFAFLDSLVDHDVANNLSIPLIKSKSLEMYNIWKIQSYDTLNYEGSISGMIISVAYHSTDYWAQYPRIMHGIGQNEPPLTRLCAPIIINDVIGGAVGAVFGHLKGSAGYDLLLDGLAGAVGASLGGGGGAGGYVWKMLSPTVDRARRLL